MSYEPDKDPESVLCVPCGAIIRRNSPEWFMSSQTGKCPVCHAPEPPANYDARESFVITWHELRTLTLWAERWAVSCDVGTIPNQRWPGATPMRKIVRSIVDRLGVQHLGPALLLSQELAELNSQREVAAQDIDPDAPNYVQNVGPIPQNVDALGCTGQPDCLWSPGPPMGRHSDAQCHGAEG
jgi:hypothetical protein